MADYDYLADAAIAEEDLSFEPYNRNREVKEFDCGEAGLNKFLWDQEEVAEYQESGLGTTTLVYCHGMLVGFFTLNNDALELKYVDAKKMSGQIKRKQKEVIESIPAIKIGRFAVHSRLQKKGIGRFMMRYIVGLALSSDAVAVRLLILEAYPTSQPFYQKLGFQFTEEKKRERGRRNRTMFLDLEALKDVA